MWGDDYTGDDLAGRTPPQDLDPPRDTGSPVISAILILIALALILTCVPGTGS